ncbi:short-chain dehydrogenase [Mycobacterium kansasii]|uniref:SDR family NAD(P)-dependent oxidoreductase n=1 Tax=Mycobacterium kansasii TaxID=1768 RepID=UPI000CDD2CE2|nr:SDR family NAD(P)-dependent oxidoreductase [Mycobacterium kansasii]POX87520.1 short-chain dehydrogenase [Mycobacterium kansasii]POY00456.1 short-chain dehydrogenase [Mycobacterium kansasii]POY09197.1 short-chain dehydrogenase [Mycobacterium kansasii]POY25191.1 short-chain dehydrogenase [Mycobacterium kansasii]POY29814.1 short-chain dehydrogenase [Mycobacterium kansasii]
MELAQKRVLITGASRGIGEALAHAFAGAGATVALVARTEGLLRTLAVELGGSAHIADLSDPGQVATLIDRVEDEVGPIDVLVNNAGIDNSTGGFADAPDDDLRKVTQVNYLAPAELCRRAIPRMLRRGAGHIVNVSSMGGCVVLPGLVSYSASKAALSHFTAGLRADLRGLPIRTTLVELGPIPTDLLAHTEDYPPTADSFRRLYRMHLMVDVTREVVADQVVSAVQKGRKHVRLPRRAAVFSMLAEAPRRTAELVLTGIPHQTKRSAGLPPTPHSARDDAVR